MRKVLYTSRNGGGRGLARASALTYKWGFQVMVLLVGRVLRTSRSRVRGSSGGLALPKAKGNDATLLARDDHFEGRDADVERVARSLSENLYAFGDENISDCGEWEDMSDGAREVYRIAARAALQALGERG